ncbi:MAG: hypothetical protein AB1512_02925 [Thermodesulfobacteriota bacterium]
MRRILDLLRKAVSSRDLMDTKVYVQVLGRRVAETGIPKAKADITVISEDTGNKLEVSVTEIGQLDCGHWNVELAGQCCVCQSTYCKFCVSQKVGFICAGCGRFVCPTCAHRSITDPQMALCGQCGTFVQLLPALVRRHLCGPS